MAVHTLTITPSGSLTFNGEGYQLDETIFDFAPQLKDQFDVIVADVASKNLTCRFCEKNNGVVFTHDIIGLEVSHIDSVDPLLEELIKIAPDFLRHFESLETEQ